MELNIVTGTKFNNVQNRGVKLTSANPVVLPDETVKEIRKDSFKINKKNYDGRIPVASKLKFDLPEFKSNTPKTPTPTDVSKTVFTGASVASDGASFIFEKFDFVNVSDLSPLKILDSDLFNKIDLNFLDGFDAFGVRSLKLLADGFRVVVNAKDLKQNIKEKNSRDSAWAVTNLAKNSWGLVVGGFKTVEAGANLGIKLGINTESTAQKISAKSKSVSKAVTIVAIPFSVATSGLYFWDLMDKNKKLDEKRTELEKFVSNNTDNPNPKLKKINDLQEKNLQKQVKTYELNRNIMGASFAFSSISTVSLIASVAVPSIKTTATAISIATNIAASLSKTASDDEIRDNVAISCKWAKNKINLMTEEKNRFMAKITYN